jgi:hypothetical protein
MEIPCYGTPLVMGHYPVKETHHPLMKTQYHLWKLFLKNKELSFVETIFEKQGMFEKNKSISTAYNCSLQM